MEEVAALVAGVLLLPSVILVVAGSWVLAGEALKLPKIIERRSLALQSRVDRLYIEAGHPDAPDDPRETMDEAERMRDAASRSERVVFGAALLFAGLTTQVIRYLAVAIMELGPWEAAIGVAFAAVFFVVARREAQQIGGSLRESADEIVRAERRADALEADLSDA